MARIPGASLRSRSKSWYNDRGVFYEPNWILCLVFAMSSTVESNAPLDLRLPGSLRPIVERAATHLGQTVNEFAAATVVRSAYDVIEQHERTLLSNRDRDSFLALLDDTEAEPNDALREAASQYRRHFSLAGR